MDYRTAFEETLTAVRGGASLESRLAVHPEHADRLREDMALVEETAAYQESITPPSEDEAWSRFERDLGELRERRQSARAPRHVALPMPLLRNATIAAVLAVATFAVFSFLDGSGGVIDDAGEAEAARVEGIVVENIDGVMTVQTAYGLEEVRIDPDAFLADNVGQRLSATAIEPGQIVFIEGQRLAASIVVARRLDLGASALTRRWCAENAARCREVEALLNQAADGCVAGAPACERIRVRIRELTQDLPQVSLLDEARERCEQSDEACRELLLLCQNRPDICEALRDGIVKRATGSEAERLRLISQRCLAGDAAACRELRQICAMSGFGCRISDRAAPAPSRPALQPTPARPAAATPTTAPADRMVRPTATPTPPARNPVR
jgi:hypothetical protein